MAFLRGHRPANLQRRPVMGHRQSGVAIITVLLIVSLMVTLLGFLIEQQHLLVRRIGNQTVFEQGHQYASGVDEWAVRVLFDDADRAIDYLDEDWAAFGKPPVKNDGGSDDDFSLDVSSQRVKEIPIIDFGVDGLSYKIEDLQGRLNLNNLSNPDPKIANEQKQVFSNLLDQLEIGEFDDRQQLISALVNWLDSNGEGPHESPDYQIEEPAYYAADQKLTSIGELHYVKGFTKDVINELTPYISVLPVDNAGINLNTASVEVIASLKASPVIDASPIATFLAARDFDDFIGFNASNIPQAQTAINNALPKGVAYLKNVIMQTSSQFFQVSTRVQLGDYVYCTYSLVNRPDLSVPGASDAKIKILNRQHSSNCNEIIH